MADPRDYCETLGVARDTNEKAIKDAFRRLALKYPAPHREGIAQLRRRPPGRTLRAASGSRARAAHRAPARIVRAVEGQPPPETKLEPDTTGVGTTCAHHALTAKTQPQQARSVRRGQILTSRERFKACVPPAVKAPFQRFRNTSGSLPASIPNPNTGYRRLECVAGGEESVTSPPDLANAAWHRAHAHAHCR